jgi:hypothetical protein
MRDRLDKAVIKQATRMETELSHLTKVLTQGGSPASVFYCAKKFVEQYDRLNLLMDVAGKDLDEIRKA